MCDHPHRERRISLLQPICVASLPVPGHLLYEPSVPLPKDYNSLACAFEVLATENNSYQCGICKEPRQASLFAYETQPLAQEVSDLEERLNS